MMLLPSDIIIQWGVGGKGGEGEVDIHMYVHVHVTTCLNEIKKGGETSKSKILRLLKRGI